MMNRRALSFLLVMTPLICIALPADADTPVPTAAQTAGLKPAARAWLAKLDAGDHSSTWGTAAAPFKTALTAQQWQQALKGARNPLGAVVKRQDKATTYTRSLPGAPDGQYAVMQFDTEFANKTKAVETVTSVLEADGVWRVTGYFIR